MSDPRAWPSERFAFAQLGLTQQLKSESDLITETSGTVPEAIFRHPSTNKIMSIEVKRIVGNSLPECGKGRRLIRRRKSIIWPWTSTVEAALKKANDTLVNMYMIQEHHIAFVVPDNLSTRSFERVYNHIETTVHACKEMCSQMMVKRIRVHIIQGPVELFDRF